MSANIPDLSVFEKFNFTRSVVGVKFSFAKPDGITKLNKKIRLCAMITEAQTCDSPFYVNKDNEECGMGGSWVMGWLDIPPECSSGGVGIIDGTYREPRANRRIYDYIPMLMKGTINYIMFSPLAKLSFDPDLLIIMTDNDSQAEIIFRAASYANGNLLVSKMTQVIGCAWLYVYPYKTGEINYMNTGLFYGPGKRYKIFPTDRQIISIPFDWLPLITQNLKEMPWVLPEFK
jgi:uncharacterized protein (DUF169 family)